MKSLFFSSHSKRRLSRSPSPSSRRPGIGDPPTMPVTTPPVAALRSRNQHSQGISNSVQEASPSVGVGQSTFQSPAGSRYQHGESKAAPLGAARAHQHQQAVYPTFTPNNNNPCNSFLLGGHYYPGKDKSRNKRRLDRSRTRRQFWALWGGLSLLFGSILFVTGRLLLSPFFHDFQGVVDFKRDLGLKDQSLHVMTLQRESEGVEVLENLRRGQHVRRAHERRDILERIVPEWLHRYHRSNPINLGNLESKNQTLVSDSLKSDQQGLTSQKRKLESEAGQVRRMISLANMGEHHGNSCPAAVDDTRFQTTLVVQASWDRLWVLRETCRRWRDPIVAVVGSSEASYRPEHNATYWNAMCPQLTLLIQRIDSDPALYPVNQLRNLALDAVTTSHILVVDVDFVPSRDLEATIRRVLEKQQQQQQSNEYSLGKYEALVVPAFERLIRPPCTSKEECQHHLQSNSSFLPETFADLWHCVQRQDCQVFQSDVNWEGHYSTRTEEWLEGEWYRDGDRSQPRTISCFHTLRYEPYVVIRWCDSSQGPHRPVAPYYDERFYGYGKNKIEYIQHLRLLGYQFQVLPEGFLTHNPHVDSKAKEQWAGRNSQLHHDMDRLYPKFLRELLRVTNHSRPIVLPCPKEGS